LAPPVIVPGSSWSFEGRLSTRLMLALVKSGLTIVSVQVVLLLRGTFAGAHVLSSVTGACPRTIVIGKRSLRCPSVMSIEAKRVSPSGTSRASSEMLNVALPPAGTETVLGVVILRSLVVLTFSCQVALLARTLWSVRCTVTAPGIEGMYRLG